MKRILLSLAAIATLTLHSLAQAPESFNYQAVVRNAGGMILNNQPVGMRLTVQQGSIGGTAVYTETFSTTTNDYGIVNLQIGTGTSTDDFSTIDWANGPYFMETAVDFLGGMTWVVMGTSQLMSVPYALYAGNAYWDKHPTEDKVRYTGSVGVRGYPGIGDSLVDLTLYSLGDAYSEGTMRLKGTNANSSYSQWTDLKSSYDGHQTSSKFSVYTRNQGIMNENFVVNSLGYAGIGVSSPIANFQLQNNGFADALIESTGNIEDASLWLKNPSKTWRIHGDQSDADKLKIGLWTDYSEIGGSNLLQYSMTIDTLGNVGIGNPNPEVELDLNGDMRIPLGNALRLGGSASSNNSQYTIHVPNTPGAPTRVSMPLDVGTNRHFEVGYYINNNVTDMWKLTLDVNPVKQKVTIADVMNITPRANAPAGPSKGDVYMDDTTNKLMVYDGAVWQACW
jgi:hypothetical protein